MASENFSAQVSGHVKTYKKRMLATFRASAQDVAHESIVTTGNGGRMRIDTGFLRASQQASTEQMPRLDPSAKPPSDAAPNSVSLDSGPIALTIAGADLGETIYIGFVAAYARAREYKDGFVRGAAENWQKIVAKNARKAVERIK